MTANYKRNYEAYKAKIANSTNEEDEDTKQERIQRQQDEDKLKDLCCSFKKDASSLTMLALLSLAAIENLKYVYEYDMVIGHITVDTINYAFIEFVANNSITEAQLKELANKIIKLNNLKTAKYYA